MFCPFSCARGQLISAEYSRAQLPLSSENLWAEVGEAGSKLIWYPMDKINATLREVLQQRHDANFFNLDHGEPDGYLFLPDKGSVRIMIESQSSVVNSNTLITLLENKVIDQILVGFSGPDDEQIIRFSLDKKYILTLDIGDTSIEDEDRRITWKETRKYLIEDNGTITEIKKLSRQ